MSLLDTLIERGHTRLYIRGEWVEASDASTFEVLDPSNGRSIAEVSSGSVEDALAAVEAAHEAAADWSSVAPRTRGEILRNAFRLMIDRADQLAELITLEMGKAIKESRAEVAYAAEFFRWFSEEAVRNQGTIQRAPGGDKRIVAIHQPVGVALLITPWNFPAAMATRKIGPAVAAGCTMVLKPASDTPLTSLAIAALMEEAGLPPGVLNVLPSRRSSQVVAAMLADDRVRKLSFTGSTEVGRTLLELAARRVVNCSMELGGNAPFLVFEDADLEAAVEGAMVAKLRNGGQSCIAANRIYVHEKVADRFADLLAKAMESVRVGPGLDPEVELGPVINAGAQADMEEAVELAVSGGGRVKTGGGKPDSPGFFYLPTVVDGVSPDNPVLRREIFGPVAPVVRFSTDEEAVRMANDSIHGLAAYLYTSDLARAMRTAEAIEAGMVGINRGLISDPAAPFGGVKQSGLGREGGHEGLMEFLETKYIAVDW